MDSLLLTSRVLILYEDSDNSENGSNLARAAAALATAALLRHF
jgi:hypothetical protein